MSDSPGATALNLEEIHARVDGMKIIAKPGGTLVGLAIIQAANAPGDPVTIRGSIANSQTRRSYLPGLDAHGMVAEDFGMSETCSPQVDLGDTKIVRLTAARSILPGAILEGAEHPRSNYQKTDLRDAKAKGWKAKGVFLEEGDISGIEIDEQTDLGGGHLQDTKRTGVDFHAENVQGADLGHEGPGAGQPRKAARITKAATLREQTTL